MKILDCPFCGGRAEASKIIMPDEKQTSVGFGWVVKCTECKAHTANNRLKSKAIRTWNNRYKIADDPHKLACCPMCGYKAGMKSYEKLLMPTKVNQKLFYVECTGCGVSSADSAIKSKATKLWNSRKGE